MTAFAVAPRARVDHLPDCWSLVSAARAGDRAAFERLYAHYQPQILYKMLKGTSDPHTAQDLTSNTFTLAWRHLDQVTDPGDGRDLGLWLSVIAANLLKNHYRRQERRAEHLADEVPEPATEARLRAAGPTEAAHRAAEGPEAQVLAAADRRHAAALVGELMTRLSTDQRRVLELRDLNPEPLSWVEVGAAIGRTGQAARQVRQRALDTMRRQLDPEGRPQLPELSKATAVRAAFAAVGSADVPTVRRWLRERGVTVSRRYVYNVRDSEPDPASTRAAAPTAAEAGMRSRTAGQRRVANAVDRARVAVDQLRTHPRRQHQAVEDEFTRLATRARAWQHHADQHEQPAAR